MNLGKTIFAQLIKFLPIYEFRQCIQRYQGTYKVQTFSCWDQFLLPEHLILYHSLYTILQILSVSLFEKTDLYQLLTNFKYILPTEEPSNQLNLFT